MPLFGKSKRLPRAQQISTDVSSARTVYVVIPAPGVGWDRGCLRRARPVASQNRTKALPAETKDGEWVLGRSVVVGVTKGFFLSDLFPGYLGGSNICEMCNGTIFKMKTYCFLA